MFGDCEAAMLKEKNESKKNHTHTKKIVIIMNDNERISRHGEYKQNANRTVVVG